MITPPLAIGVDGFPGGWITVALDAATNRVVDGRTFPHFSTIVTTWPEATIGVDMPIGYAEGTARRACDEAARQFVGARRSSVFFVPTAAVLAAESYDDANTHARASGAAGISKQLWALRTKIAEVAAAVTDEDVRARVFEVFPEAAFCALNGAPLDHAKRTWHGHELRRVLLAKAGVELDAAVIDAGAAAPDDVLDAAALAWSTARIVRGEAASLPADATTGPRIWY
ncbi:MAG: hypothetical protein QOK28_1768 [Actinomycetota bacterium]|jgi:predicted RNase H-like nuclease